MRIKPLVFLTACFLLSIQVQAQRPKHMVDTDSTGEETDDLMAMLDEENGKKAIEYTQATFKTTRLVNGHTIENTGKGVLDFRVNHRFGRVKDGIHNFFGLDNATTRIGFDYGVTNWLMIGIGRSTFEKEYDGLVKVKILRQRDTKGMPVSLSYMGAMSAQSLSAPTLPAGQEYYFSNRLCYTNQLLVARKFNDWFSLQLMPTIVHYNLVPTKAEPNDVLAMGMGGRVKLSNRIALNVEYYYRLPDNQLNGYHNSLSVSFDIETGGHVFQLMFTNSAAMTERSFIGQTTDTWEDGGIHFGFNISRVFTIVKPKGFENSRNKVW